jgi:hypothetical protein
MLAIDIALDDDSGHLAAEKVLVIVSRHLDHLVSRRQVHSLLAGRVHRAALGPPVIVKLLKVHIGPLGVALSGLQQILDVPADGVASRCDAVIVAVEHL